jgi:hypothetical protein
MSNVLTDLSPERWRLQADTLRDAVDWINRTPAVWDQKSSRDKRGYEWTLGASYEDALKLASDGWPEGVRKLSALAATVPNGVEWFQEHDVAGHYPDVPRALAGDPFNMITRGKAHKPKPSMTLVVSYGANCDISGEAMWNYGAAVVALVDRLESRHVRCEVLSVWNTELRGRKRRRGSMAVTLKRAEEVLDLSALAFGLAHPAMLRRIGLALLERSPADQEDYGYGVSASQIQPADLINLPEGALLVGGIGSSYACSTMAGALEYVKSEINKAAGESIAELEEV